MRRSMFGAIALLALVPLRPAGAATCLPGTYNGNSINYNCADWGIDWTVNSWTITKGSGANITVTMSPGPLPTLSGTINCADSTFTATIFVTDFCYQSYTLTGKFTSTTHWAGTFDAWYGNYCDICPARTYPVQGTHDVAAVPVAPAGQLQLRAEPNPMGDGVTITLGLARAERVLLEVLDVSGRRVGVLENRELAEGTHRYRWNRTQSSGRRAPAGVYLVRALSPEWQRVMRVVALD